MVGDWSVDIKKEFGDQVVHAHLTQLLGQCGRTGNIQEHNDTLFTFRPMIGSEQKAAEDASADQPPELKDRHGR